MALVTVDHRWSSNSSQGLESLPVQLSGLARGGWSHGRIDWFAYRSLLLFQLLLLQTPLLHNFATVGPPCATVGPLGAAEHGLPTPDTSNTTACDTSSVAGQIPFPDHRRRSHLETKGAVAVGGGSSSGSGGSSGSITFGNEEGTGSDVVDGDSSTNGRGGGSDGGVGSPAHTKEELRQTALRNVIKRIRETGQISVFLSSPFKGLEEERNLFKRKELPRLFRKCELRG
jgi:hypothetical protein